MEHATSGTALIDGLIEGVHVGDNLVVQGDAAAPLDLLTERFVAAARRQVPVVVVNLAEGWAGEPAEGVVVLDWSPVRTGQASALPDALDPAAGFAEALASLEALDERVGSGAAFVFERLTAVQETWGADAALELFLTACPRLYRRRSLALWPVEADAHRPTFLRRLGEITQVVVDITSEGEGLALTVREAAGRPPDVVGRRVGAVVADGDLVATEGPRSTRERLGTVIRDQRLSLGLAQAEVARRVGITPSALSQVERGVRGPSGDTLMRLWEVLGVPFGPTGQAETGYEIARRSGRERKALQDGLTAERVAADPRAGQVWLVEVAPGASGDRPPFAVKRPEVVTVVRGVLDLTIEGRGETLHEGDALVSVDAVVGGWANPGSQPAELLWTFPVR